ncbi:MAG: hypothetical protein KAR56_02890, partial [Thermoplasmata archaeon]|nr:hypothetical protein [Thermoplasmata archaeon]
VLFIYMLTRELTSNNIAAFSAGLFAALSGLFVYVTTAAMKQLLAIVLLCFIFYLFSKRRDWRFRIGLILTLVILPFTHHLTTLMVILALSFALVGTSFRRSEEHIRSWKELILDIVTGPGILLISFVYYQAVNMEFFSRVSNMNDIVLLASVAIIMAVFARLLSITVQTKPWFFIGKDDENTMKQGSIFDEKVLVLVIGIGILLANSKLRIFTGAQLTSDFFLNLIFPYLILTVLGLIGFNILRYSRFPRRYLLVGMFMAPLTVILFSMLRSLDVFGFMMVYRSYNFIDIPLAIVVGTGMAWIFKMTVVWSRKNKMFRALPAFGMIIFIIFCAASLPLAYNNEEAFDVQEITHEYELEAMEWAEAHNISSIYSDQRYCDIIGPYYNIQADRTGAWRMSHDELGQEKIVMASWYWTDGGAQFYPLGRIHFEQAEFQEYLDSWDVYYVGGPQGKEMVICFVH